MRNCVSLDHLFAFDLTSIEASLCNAPDDNGITRVTVARKGTKEHCATDDDR